MKLKIASRLFLTALTISLTACHSGSSSSDADSGQGNEKKAALAGSNDENSGIATGLHFKLKQAWATDTSLRTPESAIWDSKQQIFYVSNVNGKANAKEGNGFISKVSPKGAIIKRHWVDGLNAPKGLGIYGGTLFVADLTQLVLIDTAQAKITQKMTAPGATFLNDIATDDQGNVYLSDTRQGKIFRYMDGTISLLTNKPEVKDANGLMVWGDHLWILAAGGIYIYDLNNEKITLFSDAVPGGDGLALYQDSTLIASRWVGEIYAVDAQGKAEKLLDTKGSKNTADISYVPELKLLIVPTFGGNTLEAYSIE